VVIPISDNFKEYAEKVKHRLMLEGFNAEVMI
jgi:threonyl-tRNA synthetase